MQAYVARTGLAVFALLFATTLLIEQLAAGRVLVAGTSTLDLPQLREIAPWPLELAVDAFAAAGVEIPAAAPSAVIEIPAAAAPVTVVAAQPVQPSAIGAAALDDAIVLASWYGPGFYGNRTACGQTYAPELLGVAHLTLPCGTVLTLTHGARSVTVAVIDRGPFIAGRTLDLSNATKLVLGCTDLCTIRMQIAH